MRKTIKMDKAKYQEVHSAISAVLNIYAGDLTPLELLALASQMVGQLIAIQDQRETTASEAMEIVIHNIRVGNENVVIKLNKSRGSA